MFKPLIKLSYLMCVTLGSQINDQLLPPHHAVTLCTCYKDGMRMAKI